MNYSNRVRVLFLLVPALVVFFIWLIMKLGQPITAPILAENSRFALQYLYPCDSISLVQDFNGRKAALFTEFDCWKYDGHGAWTCDFEVKSGHPSLERRYFAVQDNGTNAYERERYRGQKSYYIRDSDVPAGSIDTVSESITVEFEYCSEKVIYLYQSGGDVKDHLDGIPTENVDRLEADSILHSWGITRKSPPEDFPWQYRPGQLEKEGRK